VLLGKHAGGLPGSVIRWLETMTGRHFADTHLVEMRKVSGAEVVRYAFPEGYPELFRREKAFDIKNVYSLKDVIVSPDSGMVWTPEGHIFQESVGSFQRIMGWGGVLHEPLLPIETNRIEEVLSSCPDTGYFHWLLEIMPNVLDALDVAPDARILISHKRARYVTDALKMLFGEKAVEERCVVRTIPQVCSRFIMPACEPYSGFVHPRNVEMLRKAFQSEEKNVGLKEGRKLYISRREAPKRAVENEQEIEDSLEKIGFEIVCLEKLRFQEQIAIMSGASVIVGMHGAGLGNMIWARKPCCVVEVFPIGCYNDCFARLALTCEYDYSMIRCGKGRAGSNGRVPTREILRLVKHEGNETQ
jgi:hypothetical protein